MSCVPPWGDDESVEPISTYPFARHAELEETNLPKPLSIGLMLRCIAPCWDRVRAPMDYDAVLSIIEPLRAFVLGEVSQVRGPLSHTKREAGKMLFMNRERPVLNKDFGGSIGRASDTEVHSLLITRAEPLDVAGLYRSNVAHGKGDRQARSGDALVSNIVHGNLNDLVPLIGPLLRRPDKLHCYRFIELGGHLPQGHGENVQSSFCSVGGVR